SLPHEYVFYGSGVIVPSVHSSTPSSIVDNIVKAGLMKKGKRGKRIYLVLREDSYASPACIQYYESEKRFRKNKPADYVLKLKEVFSVNRVLITNKTLGPVILRREVPRDAGCPIYTNKRRRTVPRESAQLILTIFYSKNFIKHPRMKFALAVFGYKDTLYLGCDVEDDLESWFHTIYNVYTGTKSGSLEGDSRPKFGTYRREGGRYAMLQLPEVERISLLWVWDEIESQQVFVP
uniref:PH domain-containing protein n=1 Tax=Romanomermis culicivorax TaxID=13658 RepID=A0A915L0V9_ROMCU